MIKYLSIFSLVLIVFSVYFSCKSNDNSKEEISAITISTNNTNTSTTITTSHIHQTTISTKTSSCSTQSNATTSIIKTTTTTTTIDLDKRGLYVFGTRWGTDYDWGLKKFDLNGIEDTTYWNKSCDSGDFDFGYSIDIDSSGNIYAAGSKRTGANYDWWIKKYDKNGIEDTVNWNKSYDGSGGEDKVYSITVDDKGAVFAVGSQGTGLMTTNWWVKKFSSDGTEDITNWNLIYPIVTGQPMSIKNDNNGNIYIVGSKCSGFPCSWWIKKFNNDGFEDTVNWNKEFTYGGGGTDSAQDITFDSSNNVYITGYVDMTRWWVKKYSENGVEDTKNWNYITSTASSDTKPYNIEADHDDNIYVAGHIGLVGGTCKWWIKKFDCNGNEDTTNWDKTYSTGPYSYNSARAISISSNNEIYVGGYIDGQWWHIKKYSQSGIEDTTNWNKTISGGAFYCMVSSMILVE